MGVMKGVRPLSGFPVYVQLISLCVAVFVLCAFLYSSIFWIIKVALCGFLLVIFWLPRPLVFVVQRFFSRRFTVFFFPASDARAPVSSDTLESKKPLVAITVDDSPAWEFDQRPAAECSTEEIRQRLEAVGARATWFIIGSHVQASSDRPALLRKLVNSGHELANHGMQDRPAWTLRLPAYANDVTETQSIIEECGGGGGRWFRPGHAIFTPSQFSWLRSNAYRLAIASVYPHDALDLPPYQSTHPALIAWILRAKVRAGDVVVIHDRPWTPQVLDLALPALSKKFTLCTLSELSDVCLGVSGGVTEAPGVELQARERTCLRKPSDSPERESLLESSASKRCLRFSP